MREHHRIWWSNEREGLVWLDLWNALSSFYLAGRVRWPGSCERTRLPSCNLTCRPHPFHGDGRIHLPAQTLSQDLRIGRGGGLGGYLLIIKMSLPFIFLGITYPLHNPMNVFFMALRITCTRLSPSQRQLASISNVTFLAQFSGLNPHI